MSERLHPSRTSVQYAVRKPLLEWLPLGVASGKTHSLKGGPDRTSAVHNLCRRDT
jgi:hypothetical protein